MKVTRGMLWLSVEWGEELSGREGLVVVFYAVKIYCGLMLKKKLLPLMIQLVVVLN